MTLHKKYAKVKRGNETREKFRYYSGVKQGDGLSTILFKVALQTAVKKVDNRGNIFTKLSQIGAYADDVTIMTTTKNELQRIYLTLEKETNQLDLFTNTTKTKYMHLNTTKHANIRERKLCTETKNLKWSRSLNI
jgi:sorting nexin-29